MDLLLIKNAKQFDTKSGRDFCADILIADGIIQKIGQNIKAENAKIIDAKGLLAVPGLIDVHVHLREPGYEYKETVLSGSQAAVAGGFTSICCMPNTKPVIDNRGVVEFILSQNQKAGLVDLYPVGAITKGLEGIELSEIADLKEAGVIAVSDDGKPVMNSEVMRRAMEYCLMFDLPVISHSENTDLSSNGVMNEGYISTLLGLKGIPRIAEIVMVSRDVALAKYTGSRLHIAHVSCLETVEVVRIAKAQGVRVTCECCPHHFSLTDEAVKGYDPNTKVNPPLRTAEDVEAIKKGLKDGTIDCIASDHAPHSDAEKDVEYDCAPFGIIGLETSLGIAVSELVEKKVLSFPEVLEKMSSNPARLLGIDRGKIVEGAVADIAIIDPDRKWVVTKDDFRSKSRNSPFIGRELQGKTVYTIHRGKIVFELK